jgi:hypothetical protein
MCYSEEAVHSDQAVLLTEEERTLIQEKIVHECSEKVFWVPSRQRPLQCAGKDVQAFGYFRSDIKVAEPIALDQPFNILVIIPELRKGYKFVRPHQGYIVLDGYLGWLRTTKSEDPHEPSIEQYWQRAHQLYPEYFSGPTVETWKFAANFSDPQHVDFGPLDDWKRREIDRVRSAVAENIDIETLPPNLKPGPGTRGSRELTLVIGEFTKWSGYVYVIVPELNALLTVPFGLSPLGSEYPVEADSAKWVPLNEASPDLIQRIQKHSFERRIAIH